MTDGVDHIIEFIGKSYWTQNLNVLRRDGTMVYLAFMSGATFPPDANIAQVSQPQSHHLLKWLTLGTVAPFQTPHNQGQYTPIPGCRISAKPT